MNRYAICSFLRGPVGSTSVSEHLQILKEMFPNQLVLDIEQIAQCMKVGKGAHLQPCERKEVAVPARQVLLGRACRLFDLRSIWKYFPIQV